MTAESPLHPHLFPSKISLLTFVTPIPHFFQHPCPHRGKNTDISKPCWELCKLLQKRVTKLSVDVNTFGSVSRIFLFKAEPVSPAHGRDALYLKGNSEGRPISLSSPRSQQVLRHRNVADALYTFSCVEEITYQCFKLLLILEFGDSLIFMP